MTSHKVQTKAIFIFKYKFNIGFLRAQKGPWMLMIDSHYKKTFRLKHRMRHNPFTLYKWGIITKTSLTFLPHTFKCNWLLCGIFFSRNDKYCCIPKNIERTFISHDAQADSELEAGVPLVSLCKIRDLLSASQTDYNNKEMNLL